MGGFLKWWYPTTIGFPIESDHFGVFWGYHHLRNHPPYRSLLPKHVLCSLLSLCTFILFGSTARLPKSAIPASWMSLSWFNSWSPKKFGWWFGVFTLPETNVFLHLKMDGWNLSFLLGWPIFNGYDGYVSFRDGPFTDPDMVPWYPAWYPNS